MEERESYIDEWGETVRDDAIAATTNVEVRLVVENADIKVHSAFETLEGPVHVAALDLTFYFPQYALMLSGVTYCSTDEGNNGTSKAALTAKLASGPDEILFSRISYVPTQGTAIGAILRIQASLLITEILLGLMPE